jgi:hypothetical protein
MGASTNVTSVLWGTAWTSTTMLAQRIAYLRDLEHKDGIRRVFRYDAQQVERLGRQHPIIRTQYYLEEIDAEGGLFPPHRRALMRGDHSRRHEPQPGRRYALAIDVAGEEEQNATVGRAGDVVERAMIANFKRDATALTVLDVDVEYGKPPVYRAVDRRFWLGVKHTTLYAQIIALARHWRAIWVVINATGVGAGLASLLAKELGERVLPVIFSPKTKSELGWGFVGVVETGRYRDYTSGAPVLARGGAMPVSHPSRSEQNHQLEGLGSTLLRWPPGPRPRRPAAIPLYRERTHMGTRRSTLRVSASTLSADHAIATPSPRSHRASRSS